MLRGLRELCDEKEFFEGLAVFASFQRLFTMAQSATS
jgi:hypothetical protein